MIRRGDSLYIKGKNGPEVGKVVCSGRHGAIVECGGKRRKVRWDGVLGRKEVVNSRAKVVDQGLDGGIIEHADGARAYVHGLQPPEPETKPAEEPGTWDKLQLRKSVALFRRG